MKICYLADVSNVHTQKWAQFFLGCRYDVEIISFKSGDIPGVKIHHIHSPLGKIGYLLVTKKISRLIYQIAPDLLHAHHATSYGLVGALSGYHPYLISSWGSDVIWSPHQSFLFDWMLRYNFRHADRVTATSYMLAKATSAFCPPGTEVRVIPFGVDTEVFAPPSFKVDSPLTVGTVKTLRSQYGIRELILAFHQIANNFPSARLVIVGGGEQLIELQAMVVHLRLQPQITLTGYVDHKDIPKYLHTFDVFVVPSFRESFGVAAVEASACGLPVIASNVGGLPEVILNGQTGLLIPPGDITALAQAMSRLLANPLLRQQMGQAGRQFVLANYRWVDNAELMEKLYEEVLAS